jgi:predicted 2-oxoglutarate/Fe(II)-dependent dioxygenase YbiX
LKTDINISTAKFEHDLSDNSTLLNQTRYAHYFRDAPDHPSSLQLTRIYPNLLRRWANI